MAPPNVEATTIILDIGPSVCTETKNGLSYFEQSIACISRIIERKIFSRPKDLIGLILMGSEETHNNLALQCGSYSHITTALALSNPSWDIIETLQNKIKPSKVQADWVDALVVAADFLRTGLTGVKVSCKKVVLMTDFKTPSDVDTDQMQQIIDSYKDYDIESIIIGQELDDFESIENRKLVEAFTDEVKGIVCSFENANSQLKFHKKKSVTPYPWYADLTIGPDIKIPVTGFGKIREDSTTAKWNKTYKSKSEASNDDVKAIQSHTKGEVVIETVIHEKTFFRKDDNTLPVNSDDIIHGYLYGQTIVPYSKIDKSMEYQSGPKCLTVYGFTKRENINWGDLSGDGITYLVPKKEHENAKKAVDALVTVLNDLDFVAVARKVHFSNSAPRMVALFPIVKEDYKCLSMIALAYKEDYRNVIFPKLNQNKFLPNNDQLEAVDNLIKSMDLDVKDEEDKPIFSVETTVNPKLQHIYDSIAYRALNPHHPLPPPRPDVQKLLDVPSTIAKLAEEPLEKIKNCFPLVIMEKTKSGQHWVNDHLTKEESKPNIDCLPQSKDPPSVTSVLTTKITKIGTVDPVEDFRQLINAGKTLAVVCEQLSEIIENLVVCAFGDDFSKPVSAIKAMRDECLLKNPSLYNEWLTKFKVILLGKFKIIFFQHLLDNKLSLVTSKETSLSAISEREAEEFGNVLVDESISNPVVMDTTEIDSLFADDD